MQAPQPKRHRPAPVVVTIDDEDDEQELPAPAAGGVKLEAPEAPPRDPEEVKQEAAAADDEEQPDDQQENAPNAEEPDIQIKEEPQDGRPRKKMTKRNKKTVRNNQKANLQADLETVTVRLVEVKQENSGLKEVDQQREEEIAKLTDGLNERQAKIVELEQKVSKYAAKVANQRNTPYSRSYDAKRWAERAPFDMPNCTPLVHRMDFRPVALQNEWNEDWMYDLVLYVKEDPDPSPFCAFVQENFRQQPSLCEFLHEITKRLPQTVYAQSKALLLGEDNDRLRFEQFAAGNRNVVNSS
ncbi:hypothetical protein M3Y99_01423700 [Aphelenchoides fujianensis]|nr:hypothetical protein M3Y99_01423700 [Aphelenchoides fujianensis]